MSDLWLFVSALLAIYLIPGPDMLLVLGTSANEGPKSAIAVAIGLAIARAIHVCLAAMGLVALFRIEPWTYELVRLFGAAYLLFIGWRIFRSGVDTPGNSTRLENRKTTRTYLSAGYRGFATNLFNPKALIFCSVLLPQFVDPAVAHASTQFSVLGLILVLLGLLFDIFYALVGRRLGALTASNLTYQRIQNLVFAMLMMLLGLRVAIQ